MPVPLTLELVNLKEGVPAYGYLFHFGIKATQSSSLK
jgi:hypothetical protein